MSNVIQSVKGEFKSTNRLVEYVLENIPETRNCDIKLYVECCKILGAEKLDDISKFQINPQTIVRSRKWIQNTEGKFLPTDQEIIKRRARRSEAYKQVLREAKTKIN